MDGARSAAPSEEAHEAAAAFGITIVDSAAPPERYEVWAEHWPTLQVYARLWRTQWHTAFNGERIVRTGLNYTAALVIAKALGIKRSRHADVLDGLAVCEAEGLAHYAKAA